MRIENPYHEGELLVQQRVGEVHAAQRNGRVISSSILKGALKYVEQQPLAVFGSVDNQGNVWASTLIGNPGFLRAPDERSVEVDLAQIALTRPDPFWTNIKHNPQVGMLVIDLGTRRRLRINGQISRVQEKLRLAVVETYPNCPKYIQRRHVSALVLDGGSDSLEQRRGHSLDAQQQAFIRAADTFFVASAHPERGVDASHRGGNPGFLKLIDGRKIRVPDYVGNSMFNTLGNLTVNPRAGLAFLDFERSRTLQLIGRAEVLWRLDDPTHDTGGTRRYWDFEIDQWLEMDLSHQIQWEFLDYSPHNPEVETEAAMRK